MLNWIQELEMCLKQLLFEHEQLLSLVKCKQQAISMAKPDVITNCCQRENHHVQEIGRIEIRRQKLIGKITQSLEPQAAQPLGLSELASYIPEPRRGVLVALQQKLKDLIKTVQREISITRQALEGLMGHVKAVIGQVASHMGGPGTYGRGGDIQQPTVMTSSLNITG